MATVVVVTTIANSQDACFRPIEEKANWRAKYLPSNVSAASEVGSDPPIRFLRIPNDAGSC